MYKNERLRNLNVRYVVRLIYVISGYILQKIFDIQLCISQAKFCKKKYYHKTKVATRE